MEGYLGEFDDPFSEYREFTPVDWALTYIGSYGQIDGDHHKAWVLDQVSRILHGTPVIVKVAKWSNGHFEHRFTTGEPSEAYLEWVESMKLDENGEEYWYMEGTAP